MSLDDHIWCIFTQSQKFENFFSVYESFTNFDNIWHGFMFNLSHIKFFLHIFLWQNVLLMVLGISWNISVWTGVSESVAGDVLLMNKIDEHWKVPTDAIWR